jgi:hypothetical protein
MVDGIHDTAMLIKLKVGDELGRVASDDTNRTLEVGLKGERSHKTMQKGETLGDVMQKKKNEA